MRAMYKGHFGLEREAVRVDAHGVVSETSHPKVFGECNPYIQRDFAEAQVEMITSPCESIDKMVNLMRDIESIVLNNIGDDYLWNQSNPPIIKEGYSIPVAHFEYDKSKVAYREYLLERYGQEKSIISGIHFNYSLDEDYIRQLHKDSALSYGDFKEQLYLKLAKYVLKDRWFFIYLTNASPIFHNSYYHSCVDMSNMKENGDCVIEGMNSLRNSICGYRNKEAFYLDYSSLKNYEGSVNNIVKQGSIISESELYAPLRIKKAVDGSIGYLELRFLDIYPFDRSGTNPLDLKYLHMYLLSKVAAEDFDFDKEMQKEANHVSDAMAKGRDFSRYTKAMQQIHDDIVDFEANNPSPYNAKEIFDTISSRIKSHDNSYVAQLLKGYADSSYIQFHTKAAIDDKCEVVAFPFVFSSYPNLELSTKILIQAAIKHGYEFAVLDEDANFIVLRDPITDVEQLIMQATKTNLDGYGSVLAMENKAVSKHLLEGAGIRAPKGDVLTSITSVKEYVGKSIVVKPNTTNFGEGITIFPNGASAKEITKALEFAFTKDTTVLVEEFVSGKEYRFLVIDQKVVGVLHRVAAHVIGDGVSSITHLIQEKNKHPYRNKNYTTPLEIIEVDNLVLDYLHKQDLTPQSIPKLNEIIYLRENSNISTGGDSIDVSDDVHPSYKELAIAAAKAFGVSVSGIDIIIKDIAHKATSDNYSVLELNFNPAIHIHTYPLVGMNRYPADKLLEALFKKEVR